MSKITLTDLVNLENETTAVNAINANNAAVEAAFENTLSRDGTTPNQMESSLDMNSNPIYNLPTPTSNYEPLRVIDVGLINGGGITVSPLPIGGDEGDFLIKSSSTDYDVEWAPFAETSDPIVILATGQSNFVQRPAFSWTPAPNVLSWNYNDTDGNIGNAFIAVPSTTINMPEKIASDIARANPNRQVYVIGVAIGSQSIAQWLPGASAPDMYANITNNVPLALAAAGVTKIDAFFWWQGENQTANPDNYVNDFNTLMTRFRTETWFPRATPITVYGIAPSTISGTVQTDVTNAKLQACVRSEPDCRRMIYTGDLGAAYWEDTLHPSGVGMFTMGQMGADAYVLGQTHLPMQDPINKIQNASVGRPAFRNLIKGDFTTNPWSFGTSFAAVANGTLVLDDTRWVSAGSGVVTIQKTADAPTVAQAGIFTQHCLDVDVTTADTVITGPDYYGVAFDMSGTNTSFLGFGQTGAKNVVVSFWVKSTVTGNYFVNFVNSALNRTFCTQYSVQASNTWEKKFVVIPGDVAGTWNYASGTVGIRAFFTIAAGDAYLFTPDVWNAGDVRVGNVTRANGMSSASNNFKLALVQIEEGLYPSTFDRIPETALNTAMTLNTDQTVTGAKTFGSPGNVSKLRIAGSSAGVTVLDTNPTAGGTVTVPAVTDQLVGRNTIDTLTNKTMTNPTLNAPLMNNTTFGTPFTMNGSTSGAIQVQVPAIAGGNFITIPAATDQLVARNTVDTLTNKTITSPTIATILNSGTLTLPTGTHTLIGRATTDTLTNKTFDTAGTGNSFAVAGFGVNATTGSTATIVRQTSPTLITPILGVATATSINGSTVSPGHYSGEPSTGNAVAGEIGEVIQSNIPVGSAVALTTATAANLTSIVLTPGDWDVSLSFSINPAATTSVTAMLSSISTTSATRDLTTGGAACDQRFAAVVPASPMSQTVGPLRVQVSSNTTYYGVVQSNFTVSTNAAYGILRARRMR